MPCEVGWGEFVRQVEYKAVWYGRTIVRIDRFYPSSKTCSMCGYVLDNLPLDIRSWICPECGTGHDRDINAATNIRTVGLTVLNACGGDIRRSDVRASYAFPDEAGIPLREERESLV